MLKHCALASVQLLNQLRSVCPEVGGLAEARRMPSEIRRWWIAEMEREKSEANGAPGVTRDGRQIVRDVPRGRRGE